MKNPSNMARHLRELQNRRRLDLDGFLRETFVLPVDEARAKARELLSEYPKGGYMTIVENWRLLPDGRIEFAMRRLPTAD